MRPAILSVVADVAPKSDDSRAPPDQNSGRHISENFARTKFSCLNGIKQPLRQFLSYDNAYLPLRINTIALMLRRKTPSLRRLPQKHLTNLNPITSILAPQ